MKRDPEARALWHERYAALSEGRPGLIGAATGRAESHVMRLALIYAVLDDADSIGLCHLEAGLEVWRYADESAKYIFGDAIGDPDSDKLLKAIQASGAVGLTLTEQSRVFDRHLAADKMAQLREDLRERGLARPLIEATGGRNLERWVAIGLNSHLSLNSHSQAGGES